MRRPLPRRRRVERARWRALALVVMVAGILVPAALLATAQPQTVRVVSVDGHGEQRITMTYNGRERGYTLYVPLGLPPGRHALLVALHPLHRDASYFEATSGLDASAAVNDAVIAYPDGAGHSWDAGTCCGYAVKHGVDDVGFITRVVADVQSRVAIDPTRIAATGFSNGALMSYRLICERPDIFSAAVAVAGDAVGDRCSPARPVNLLAVHGARDRVIPLAGVVSSRLDPRGFPSAAASAERIAAADGCTGATTLPEGLTVHWSATGCPAGISVELLTNSVLTHHYPTGPADERRTGLDMSRITWSFLHFVRAT